MTENESKKYHEMLERVNGIVTEISADSLGLDVTLAERILGRTLPDLEGVIANLILHLKDRRS